MNLGSKYKRHVFKCHDRQSYRCEFCEVEDVYVRFLKDGEAVNAFVGLKSCSSAKLPGVTEAANIAMTDVCQILKKKLLPKGLRMPLQWMEKLVEFYALLKRDVPHLIKVHWIAHSLELAFLDTVKAVLQLKEAKGMLQVIRKHYHYSAKAVRELKELARCMQMKACKNVKADGTRLVLHLKRALDIPLLKNYYPAETHLHHTSQARDVSVTTQDRASNYCRKLVSYKFLFFPSYASGHSKSNT